MKKSKCPLFKIMSFSFKKLMLCRQIRDKLRKELAYLYRNSDIAFGEMDFSGLGYITEEAFLDSVVVKQKLNFSD